MARTLLPDATPVGPTDDVDSTGEPPNRPVHAPDDPSVAGAPDDDGPAVEELLRLVDASPPVPDPRAPRSVNWGLARATAHLCATVLGEGRVPREHLARALRLTDEPRVEAVEHALMRAGLVTPSFSSEPNLTLTPDGLAWAGLRPVPSDGIDPAAACGTDARWRAASALRLPLPRAPFASAADARSAFHRWCSGYWSLWPEHLREQVAYDHEDDPAALRAAVTEIDRASWDFPPADDRCAPNGDREDTIDGWLDRLLDLDDTDVMVRDDAQEWLGSRDRHGRQQRDPLPTSYRRIRAALRLLAPTHEDVLYDLGCGYGRFVLYAALTTPAQVRGIELVRYRAALGQRAIRRFAIRNARIVNGSVTEKPFDDGTAFYLYDPFAGHVWDAVLARLHAIAVTRPIRVVVHVFFEETAARLAAVSWLRREDAAENAKVVLYRAAP